MKNVWFLGLVCLLLVSCGSGGKEKSGSEDRVCACAGGNTCAGGDACKGQGTCTDGSTCSGQGACKSQGTCAGGSTCAGGDACKGQGTCAGQNVAAGDCVEVLCFHGKQRCATCIAIERNTREVLEKEFADELKQGKVVFRIVDISQSENQELAEKYEVTWSSLFVVKHRDGKESSENLTEFAFGNARKSPDTFKAGLVKTVSGMLK